MIDKKKYRRTVDSSGRITIPVVLRKEVLNNKNIFMTRGLDNSVIIVSQNELEKLKQKLKKSNLKYSMINRKMVAPAEHISIDFRGRVALPPLFLAYLGNPKILYIYADFIEEMKEPVVYLLKIKEVVV